ncbi:hypothetical protein OG474_03235 [Kribbella sp. NBC_01505]|uniref:hypothetical protein n=1 Tax=Kribbella sp. NBC_01505 TaxID=2903580 RepID=UPI003865DE4D
MAEFADVTLSRVPPAIVVPDPLRMLFEWVDSNGFVELAHDGELYGSLAEPRSPAPGTEILLRGCTSDEVAYQVDAWFGPVRDGLPILWPFCRTGGDGSTAALWHAPDGRDLIVHLGSGSGSLLTCVLGAEPVDFLRLLAIGYPEVCWNEEWAQPPEPEPGHQVANVPYRQWVETTFGVEIPATALELIPEPAEMGDEDTADIWCQWVNQASD